MRIKKKHQNQYALTEDNIWVRNPFSAGRPLDLNNLSTDKDRQLFLKNENYIIRRNRSITKIDNELIKKENIVIVSDGFDFPKKHMELGTLPFKKVTIMGTNRSLANWNLIKGDVKRAMDYFIVNNPYDECLSYIPTNHFYFPTCIMSSRTNIKFASRYPSKIKYYYTPTTDKNYSGFGKDNNYIIDDYRNPICASLGLALKFGVKKLVLFCCDDSFSTERPASVKLENGLWCYPQHLISHRIIDNILYWMKIKGINVKYHCSGPKFKNAEYIENNNIKEFFTEDDET